MNSRRSFLQRALALGAGVASIPKALAQQGSQSANLIRKQHFAHGSGGVNVVVQTPDIADLPFTLDNGVKVFHLIAEPVKQQIAPNKVLSLWGYNGSAPGPTIQINQGDRVRIIVDNHLPESTSMHWHGFEIPIEMDGGPGISQDPIKPGGRFIYEFTLHQAGTYFYHSHMAMQEMMGMLGAFIMHPKQPYGPPPDKDFVLLLQEYAVLPSNIVPNSMNMEFNWLLMNGKSGPAVTPLIVRLGDRVRIRLINLGMDHHPIHLHGHTFVVTGTEGGRIPESGWFPGNTVLVGVAQSRDVEFVANNPGDWMLHCHLPHHMMNQMSSNVGPMSRVKAGIPTGVNMENGMGMLTGEPGVPTGEDYGPSLGRGMGFGSTNDLAKSNGTLSQHNSEQDMQGMSMGMMGGEIAENADSVPGFPQDAYMEGPMMAMDEMVDKPQNFGLPAGWSGFMQGMMTFLRVLPPNKYEEVMARIGRGDQPQAPQMPAMHHMHMQHPKQENR
jgi:FtsP/CotA-like multicopper oxidase with cupredoxin domain